MGWFSTLSGGAVGMAIGGPIGAIIGAAFGYGLGNDADDPPRYQGGYSRDPSRYKARNDVESESGYESEQERKQAVFFTTVFATMGYVAKADGLVSDEEIRFVTRLMDEMELDSEEREFAKKLFRAGKSPDFSLNDVLRQFHLECHDAPDMQNFFLWILLHVAYADGLIDTRERSIIRGIAFEMGIGFKKVDEIEAEIRAEGEGNSHQSDGLALEDAYKVLCVPPTASDAKVKQAYHTLMKDYHPDVLASKGLPEEMMTFATQRTQEFSRAYDCIKRARNL